jgi:hypothetical protein
MIRQAISKKGEKTRYPNIDIMKQDIQSSDYYQYDQKRHTPATIPRQIAVVWSNSKTPKNSSYSYQGGFSGHLLSPVYLLTALMRIMLQ